MQDATAILEQYVDQLEADYLFEERPALTFIRDGQAGSTTFRVRSAAQTNILRLYGTHWHDKEASIQYELDLLLFLSAHGLPVSIPLARRDGALFGPFPAPDGPRHGALFSFAEGTVQWPLAVERSRELGRALALLHSKADAFPGAQAPRTYDLAQLVDEPIARMRPFVSKPAERVALEDLAETIGRFVGAIPHEAPMFGVIHGDIHQGNCHFNDDHSLTLFDFSLCGVGWRAYDLTGFLWPMRDATIEEAPVKASCDAFLAGYQSVRPLHPAELAAIPAFIKIRDLWEMGDWLAHDQSLEQPVVASAISTLIQRFRARPLR